MHVGITGASGLIGTALSQVLRERGDVVTPFVRPNSTTSTSASVSWDPAKGYLNHEQLRARGPLDAVIHLAGAGIGARRWNARYKEEIVRSRVASTTLLMNELATLDPLPFVVSASAIGFYGSRGDDVLTESDSAGRDFLADVCVAWEEAASIYTRSGGSLAIARTGIVLDRRGGALARQLPLFRLGLGGRLASGAQWLSPIALIDEVRALVWLLDQRRSTTANLTCPVPIRNRDFTRLLATSLKRPAAFVVPAPLLELALGREMAGELLLASQRVVPTALEDSGFVFECPDASSILRRALD
ncbi:MAG: TIGR01777 family protein [Actinobacteria bacterium 21-64-8]|nr:MAG: TIGR01777 family protein [Actinobacteria bacterium 21-64-8]